MQYVMNIPDLICMNPAYTLAEQNEVAASKPPDECC